MNCLKCNGTGQYEDKITGLTIKCECQNVKNASGLKDNCVIDNVVPSGVNTDGYIAPMTPSEVARNNGELTIGDNESAFAHGIIPKHRETDEFSPDYTRNYINECYKYDKIPVRGLDKYIELLSKILLDIRSDKRLDRSYFISAHNGYGKTTFANTCIKYLHKAGKKVVPYLSLQEIYNIVIAENLLLRINKAYITQDEKRLEHSLENSDKYVNWKANKQTGAVFEQYNVNAFVENYATFNFSYADFINCVAWGKVGELIGNTVHKGQRLIVEGAIQVRSYEGKDGVKRTVTEINVSNFEYVEKAPAENGFADAFSKETSPADDFSNIPF